MTKPSILSASRASLISMAVMMVLAGIITSCSTPAPVISEVSTSSKTAENLFRSEVQAVEVDSALAVQAMHELAIGELRSGIDQKLESERRSLSEMYPEVEDRLFILQLRRFTMGIEGKNLIITPLEVSRQNQLWIVKGEADLRPVDLVELLKNEEELWRVFQHSQWITTLLKTP